jgi:hypothetical protein
MTCSHVARRIVEAWAEAFEAARVALQTHPSPSWLERLDVTASDLVGVLFIWVRIVSATAALLWSFFLCVLPLLLATWLIVSIIAIAGRTGG